MSQQQPDKVRTIEQAYDDERPWGSYVVLLDSPACKVKEITVKPGQRLSLQSHEQRQEHWYVVSGRAAATLGKRDVSNERLADILIPLAAGESIEIPRGYKHRIANPGTDPLVFIEVQTGDYFGEDDNTRYEDDYDRPSPKRESSGEGS